MGFLDQLGGLVSPGLTVATQAAGAIQSGQKQARDESESKALKMLALIRQQQQDQGAADLRNAQIGNYKSEIDAREHPKPTSAPWIVPSGAAVKDENAPGGYSVPAPKPVAERNIDPLSPAGIAGAGKRAAAVAANTPVGNTYTTGVGPDGKPMIFAGSTKGAPSLTPMDVGKPQGTGGAGSAPMAAKVGQFGEMLKKTHDLLDATEGLDVGLGQSASRDIMEHGLGIGGARIPGTKGVGAMMVNRTPQYSQYQAALSPFILAAAHALSGARINQDQVAQIRQSVELQPGDFANPTVRAQKEKNLFDLVNSIGGSLPQDAIGAQEDQMDAGQIERLVARGYRRSRRAAAPGSSQEPSGGGKTWTDPKTGRVYHLGVPE